MLCDGYFKDDDVILAWHAADRTAATYGYTKAVVSVKFRFRGLPAHASASPHEGRSALDAVELMSNGVNYMREHIKEDARIHYVITSGGDQPNVVPAETEVWYYIRANKHTDVEEYFEWVKDIAQGAATMTRTTLEAVQVDSDVHEVLPNRTLSEVIHENLELVGAPRFTPDEIAFARQTQQPLGRPFEKALSDTIEPLPDEPFQGAASTDVGDISWFVPVGQLGAASHTYGAPGHSWQVACLHRDEYWREGHDGGGKGSGWLGDRPVYDPGATRSRTCRLPEDTRTTHIRDAYSRGPSGTTDYSLTMPLEPGTTLGPYSVTAKIGEGGMGVGYQAQDPRLKRQVAIKLLPPDLTRDETAKQRFQQEAKAASHHRYRLGCEAVSHRFFRVVVLALLIRGLAAPAAVLAQAERQLPPLGNASVAVMPFSNITGDPNDAWIGAGIAETLMADLQRAHGFTVIDPEFVTGAMHAMGLTARTSNGEAALLAVARRVGAQRMITGGYQRLGDQIRITGRLVEVQTGVVARAAKVDGALGELFGLQDQIVAELVNGTSAKADLTSEPAPVSPPAVSTVAEPEPLPFEPVDSPSTGEAGGVATLSAMNAGGAALIAMIDGPPPPMAPEVMNRDGAGRATIRAIKLTEGIRLDGRLDEEIYHTVPPVTDFIQQIPIEGAPATEKTDASIMFDQRSAGLCLCEPLAARPHSPAPGSRQNQTEALAGC